MIDPAYSMDGVCRRLGDAFRLRIDELAVHRGEVLGLLGPTGAGKSTLLRLLTGLEYPDEGVIQFNGRRLEAETPLSTTRSISMVHQRPLLLHGTVEANVAYSLRVRRRAADATVRDMLNKLGLGDLAERDARSLSGGQIQLVALARALVLDPDVLLLDEPTSNLDPSYVALIESTIASIQASRGMTVVWATHNLFQARRVSQSVALLLSGSVIEIAKTEAFFAAPKDARTANFIQGKLLC